MARKDSMERAQAKVGGFATAKKNISIQFSGRERTADNLLAMVKKEALAKGIADEEIEVVDLYVKPEEGAVYYVINKSVEGSVSF